MKNTIGLILCFLLPLSGFAGIASEAEQAADFCAWIVEDPATTIGFEAGRSRKETRRHFELLYSGKTLNGQDVNNFIHIAVNTAYDNFSIGSGIGIDEESFMRAERSARALCKAEYLSMTYD
jgi:hypothetical protein